MINPVILFIPVSSDKGIGEYTRSMIIADELSQQLPHAKIHFILNRNMKSAAECQFNTHFSDRSATKDTPLVNSVISKLKPDLVIFDCAGRSSQFAHAKRCGAKIVFISQHSKKRARGLKLRRLLFCDLHLVVQPDYAIKPLNIMERFKLKLLTKKAPINIGPIMPKISPSLDVLHQHSLVKSQYIIFSPGSGGHEVDGQLASDIFFQAAQLVSQKTDLKVVVLFGAHYPNELPKSQQILVLSHLNTKDFLALLNDAKGLVLSAGSTLLQVIEMQRPSVSVAISKDQPVRLQACANKKFTLEAKLDPQEICDKALQIIDSQQVKLMQRSLSRHKDSSALNVAIAKIKTLINTHQENRHRKYLFYISQNYSFEILRPIQKKLIERGDSCCWFVEGTEVNLNNFNASEKVIKTIEGAVDFKPDAVFVPGNHVPNFISGLKIQIFHGLEWKKKGHFKIRGFFDLYCTHGAITTKVFEKLSLKHGYFRVEETGWPKLDPLFNTKPLIVETDLPIILYAPTFSPNLTSAKECFEEIKQLIHSEKYYWIVKFHPKMNPLLMEPFKQIQAKNLLISESDSSLPLLKTANVLVSDTSSIVGEFLLLEKPVVTFRNRQPGDYLINIEEPSKLEAAIKSALAYDNNLIAKIRQENQLLHPYNDGKSTERVIKAVDKLLLVRSRSQSSKPLNFVRNLQLRKRLNYWRFF
jgi:UDP-N-acetylglucosamine 2-epimerase